MNQKVIYSMMALGTIPVMVNAADVQTINSDLLASTDGSKVTYSVGKLVPGKYKFTSKLLSKVYGVTVEIAGKKLVLGNNAAAQNVEIAFELTAETDVTLTLESSDPRESGANFAVTDAVVVLDFDFAAIKTTLAANADDLATTIGTYGYAKEDDVNAAKALKTKAEGIAESYDDYKKFKLYAEKSTIQEEIDALADKAAAAEATYQNEQAYNRVNDAITAIKAKYNAAVADLEQTLVGQAAYLLDAAKEKLNNEINLKITEATSANYASFNNKTAVADEATNAGKVPTEADLNAIVDDYKAQATDNQAAYDALHAKVTALQAALNAVTYADNNADITAAFEAEREAAQKAIDAINTKVENAKNSAAQTTLNVDADEADAQAKINTLAGKVNTANAEYNANKASADAIAAVQKAYNDAKAEVDKKVSKDGNYKAADYYAAYLETQQDAIDKLTEDAGKAYKADGTGTAQTYNNGLAAKTAPITTAINNYKTNATAAVDKYDALQEALDSYTKDIDAARAQMEGLAVYQADAYDYKTQLDLIQKRINDIKKAITAAEGKTGADHWNAMLAIDADAAITADIEALVAKVQSDQNKYDADALAGGMDDLDAKIAAFKAKVADDSVVGDDFGAFAAAEGEIEADYNAVKTAKGLVATDYSSVDLTAEVGTTTTEWVEGEITHSGDARRTTSTGGVTFVEQWKPQTAENLALTGTTVKQTVNDLPNGTYTLELYAFAADQSNANTDATDIAVVYANDVTAPVKVTTGSAATVYTLENVKVANSTLEIGMKKVKGGTNWHGIQIKSLTGLDVAANNYIKSLDAQLNAIAAQQTALETAANDVAAKVTANTTSKTTNTTNIDNLQDAMTTFGTTYKVGQDDTPLGLSGKGEGAIKKEFDAVNTALTALEGNNDAVDVTAVTNVDNTSKVDKTKAGWVLKDINISGQNYQVQGSFGIQMVEQWHASNVSGTGVVLHQTLTNLPNGVYDLVLKAHAADQRSGNPNNGRTDIVEVFANDATQPLTVSASSNVQTFTFNGLIISDGTLDMGLRKLEAGTNWHAIQIESLTYHENTSADLATYNEDYVKLAARKSALDEAAAKTKVAVEKNAETNTAATQAVADLQAAELATLKSLQNVTNDQAVSDDATAKKTDPADFKVFETGLEASKSYTARKAAIDADIAAMSYAIAASTAAETLTADWKDNSITTGEGKTAKTYSIATITAAIDQLKADAEAESANYEAYKALQDDNMSKLLPDTITMDATVAGDGALAHYQDLKDQYIAGKADILQRMQTSLTKRTAVADKKGFVAEINALIAKVKVVKSDAEANLAKYNEQKDAAKETQDLWNSVYTEIAGQDQSTIVQSWLDELDEIQVELTAALNAVEESYTNGESIAKAKDFATIKAKINDVKARQNKGYNAQITADNKAAHESFMGNDTTKGAIKLATEAYQKAVADRAKYSATNADLKAAIDAAAATLDEALYNCPTQIQKLTEDENKKYEDTQSPTVFDVSQYNADATAIEQNITAELNNFKTAVTTAISDFWDGYKQSYETKVAAAEAEIADYSADAKKYAFEDVKDLIAKGDAGVASITLSEVEAAIEDLEDIDGKLADDKNAAAVKDLTPRLREAEIKYTTVKDYINGVTIADDVNDTKQTQLNRLENAYNDDSTGSAYNNDLAYAKSLDMDANSRNTIKSIIDRFINTANSCEANVKTAVANDVNNTKAYDEMAAALATLSEKLNEAQDKTSGFKYETSFAGVAEALDDLSADVDDAKSNGYAVNFKASTFDNNDIEGQINTTLNNAFGTEKAGLASDITELKNQYNAYVAANDLDEAATAFKADIDALEKALGEAAITDLDDPADGIDFDDRIAAIEKLSKLQSDIADKESELLEANASTANADVLADFNSQLDEMSKTASLDDFDEWVGQQTLNGKTLKEQINDLKQQIADAKDAIAAEPNIAFYKDQYQAQIDQIKTELDPVAETITAKQAQFEANAAAYESLSAQIEELQGKIDAAKEKVGAYEYAADWYIYDIEYYNWYGELTGGVQYTLNQAKAAIEAANENKALNASSVVQNKANIENQIQIYLDNSANTELDSQRANLNTLLTDAIDVDNHEGVQKYSSALWARLIAEKDGINNEITDLYQATYYSNQNREGSFNENGDWVYSRDNYGNYIKKPRTSDADYEAQMETVAAIKAEIEALATAVDDLALLGDANQDGKVNVLDYQKVQNMILDPSLQPAADSDLFANIDINQSEVIEVGDLTAIVNYILNGDWQGYAAVKGMNMGGNDGHESLNMTATQLQPGTQRLAISLENVNDYTAFQLDVVLPEGMTIVASELSDRAGESHKLLSRAQLDGSVRFLASSVKGETFSGSEGAVLYVDVKTTAAYAGGSVEIVNALFADTQANTKYFTLGADATGIDSVGVLDSLKQKVYDLGGRIKSGVTRGINIIRRADGTTEKVLK